MTVFDFTQASTKAPQDGTEAMAVDSQSQQVFGSAERERQSMNATKQFAQPQQQSAFDQFIAGLHQGLYNYQIQMTNQHPYSPHDYSGGDHQVYKKPVHVTAVEEAWDKLLNEFHQLQSDSVKYHNYTSDDIRSTVSHVQSRISGLPGDQNPSLQVLQQLQDKVDQARQALMDRVTFIKSYTDEGFQYVGHGDSDVLDRIIRHQPDCEVYLFFFNFSQRDAQSEIWQFFRHLLAYKNSNKKSSYVLVSHSLSRVAKSPE